MKNPAPKPAPAPKPYSPKVDDVVLGHWADGSNALEQSGPAKVLAVNGTKLDLEIERRAPRRTLKLYGVPQREGESKALPSWSPSPIPAPGAQHEPDED